MVNRKWVKILKLTEKWVPILRLTEKDAFKIRRREQI